MERYDYRTAMKADVKAWMEDNDWRIDTAADKDGLREWLYDEMWVADSVTGNASGSYYCNTWKAEEAICHNLDLLEEALEEFGSPMDVIKNGAEACDVTIRCYLLGEVIDEVLDEMEDEEA